MAADCGNSTYACGRPEEKGHASGRKVIEKSKREARCLREHLVCFREKSDSHASWLCLAHCEGHITNRLRDYEDLFGDPKPVLLSTVQPLVNDLRKSELGQTLAQTYYISPLLQFSEAKYLHAHPSLALVFTGGGLEPHLRQTHPQTGRARAGQSKLVARNPDQTHRSTQLPCS